MIIAELKVGKPTTIKKLAEKLEVNRKTIERDIDFMSDRLQLPVARSQKGVLLFEAVKICPACAKRMTDD